jgi:hypothetical protein
MSPLPNLIHRFNKIAIKVLERSKVNMDRQRHGITKIIMKKKKKLNLQYQFPKLT